MQARGGMSRLAKATELAIDYNLDKGDCSIATSATWSLWCSVMGKVQLHSQSSDFTWPEIKALVCFQRCLCPVLSSAAFLHGKICIAIADPFRLEKKV